jgi:predicted ABC-class ATPase
MDSLTQILQRLDGASYKAYNDLKGSHDFPDFTLIFDRIQGDPFASPSHCRVVLKNTIAQFPPTLFSNPVREIALRDYLTREFSAHVQSYQSKRGSGNSGRLTIAYTSQSVLDRSAVLINDKEVEVRFLVGLPAYGRRIAGREANELLCDDLPRIIDRVLKYANLNRNAIETHINTVEDSHHLREQLNEHNLIAFVANESILPRRSGVDDRPLTTDAISFVSPKSLEVTLNTLHSGNITGMGIPAGVTLIVGGGFHGKSTLLHAIERGIYNHIPGDGRDRIVTNPTAVRIRAEEGRAITNLDISPFINHLPFDRSTTNFSTPNASGSTSQAANILEALISGSQVLLLDEDTCATNFMIRDRRMQQLIAKAKEPITPFLDRVRQLYDEQNISTILVMGGCGDYLDVADTVIALDAFQASDVTVNAKQIAADNESDRAIEITGKWQYNHQRKLQPGFLDQVDRSDRRKIRVDGIEELSIGDCKIDLSQIEQLEEAGQLRTIAALLQTLDRRLPRTPNVQQELTHWFQQSFDDLTTYPQGDLVRVRAIEVAAAIDRMRYLSEHLN